MITSIRHTGLVVNDLDKALRFWCDILGFTIVKQMTESGTHIDSMMGLSNVNVTTVKLSAPVSGQIELLKFHSHDNATFWKGTPYSIGLTHIALTVTDLDSLVSKLRMEEVIFPAPPQYSPDGLVKVIYAQGPEGVLLELVELLKS
ncbi:VOC family protein [Synechococcus sp. UW105]|uniref:VOC family protein n=1 Tax=Synechococcus sp. UW105 TaxID=337067 RepID=UPI000E0FB91D|nr:VOC family protein [Synechococcus sp. UW105]